MFVKVHRPGNFVGGDNKGSSGKLFDYLDKENRDSNGLDLDERIDFFTHNSDAISKLSGVTSIDKNCKGLGKNDNKFFMLSVNPSKSELNHLVKIATGKKVFSLDELTKEEVLKVNKSLQDYTRNVMDIYAKNFNRPDVKSGEDLIYFAKIETQREFKHFDKYVVENKQIFNQICKLEVEKSNLNSAVKSVKSVEKAISDLQDSYHKANGKIISTGMKKDGLQLHVHVVVSRNDKQQKTKLSPLSKSKGGTQKLNGTDVMQGFNHEEFKVKCGEAFNDKYNYFSTQNDQYKSKSSSTSDVGGAVAGNIKGKVISQAKATLTQGHFKDEIKIANTAKDIVQLITNPKGKIVAMAKEKIKQFIMGGGIGRG